MPEQKQILRISSTDNIRYSVLRLLHECLAAAARKGDAHSGADSPVEEQAVPSAYRHVLCGILHQFGCSDLHCTDGS